jgi:hypothetical protein
MATAGFILRCMDAGRADLALAELRRMDAGPCQRGTRGATLHGCWHVPTWHGAILKARMLFPSPGTAERNKLATRRMFGHRLIASSPRMVDLTSLDLSLEISGVETTPP